MNPPFGYVFYEYRLFIIAGDALGLQAYAHPFCLSSVHVKIVAYSPAKQKKKMQ